MSKPWIHAKSSVRKWGGVPEDYLDIHQFMDSTKAALADVRHRAILHNSFGCFIAERVFGVVRVNSAGKEYSPRDVAEQHVIEDMGHIPTLEKWLEPLKIEPWMGPPKTRKVVIPFKTNKQVEDEAKNESGRTDERPEKSPK